jgi:methylmalonyl-CoA mutase
MARLDHPDPGEANAQALDDLADGADGLAVVFAGGVGAHGVSSREGRRAVRPG